MDVEIFCKDFPDFAACRRTRQSLRRRATVAGFSIWNGLGGGGAGVNNVNRCHSLPMVKYLMVWVLISTQRLRAGTVLKKYVLTSS